MKSNFKSVLKAIGLLLLGVSLTACTVEPHKKESGINTVPVTVGRVQTVQDRETISVSGTVSTSNSPASVCFLVSGKVVSVGPREGEYVKQGQVLARIDPLISIFRSERRRTGGERTGGHGKGTTTCQTGAVGAGTHRF